MFFFWVRDEAGTGSGVSVFVWENRILPRGLVRKWEKIIKSTSCNREARCAAIILKYHAMIFCVFIYQTVFLSQITRFFK